MTTPSFPPPPPPSEMDCLSTLGGFYGLVQAFDPKFTHQVSRNTYSTVGHMMDCYRQLHGWGDVDGDLIKVIAEGLRAKTTSTTHALQTALKTNEFPEHSFPNFHILRSSRHRLRNLTGGKKIKPALRESSNITNRGSMSVMARFGVVEFPLRICNNK